MKFSIVVFYPIKQFHLSHPTDSLSGNCGQIKHGLMMMWIVEITLVLGLVLLTGAKQSYNVVAPRTIRPNTNYFVAISVDGTDGELQDVECRIYGQSATGQNIEIKQASRVPPRGYPDAPHEYWRVWEGELPI